MRIHIPSPLLCLCLACPAPGDPADSDTEPATTATGGTTAPTTATTGTTTEAPTTSTAATTAAPTDTGTTTPSACGNGQIDFGEPCDDGNTINADGCNNDCTLSGEMLWEFRSQIFVIDEFKDVVVTADNAIFAAGQWWGEGRWLTRFDENGEGVWSQTFKTAPFEAIHALAGDAGALYAAGAIRPDQDWNVWVGRFDHDGALVWEDTHDSGLGDDYATAAALTPGGDLVIAGLASVDGGLAELWTRRYGPDGTVKWTQGQQVNVKTLYSIGPGLTAAGDAIVAGYRISPQPDVSESFLVAYPPAGGAPLWTQSLPMSPHVIQGLARDPGGDILASFSGLMLRRLTGTGEPLWAASDCADATGRDVAVDSQGDIVVVGHSNNNIRVCKFAADGTLRWDREIDGGQGPDYGMGVALLADDRIVAAGQVENGDVPDAWLAMFTP